MDPKMETGGNSTSVILPLAHRMSRLIIGIFWVLMGIGWPPNWFHHASGWVAIIFGLFLIWSSAAKCVVIVSENKFSIRISGFGIGWIRSYLLSDISNLRVDYKRVLTYRPMLAFDRNARTQFFGEWLGVYLSETGQKGLLDPVYARFPRLKPS